ncbi:Swc5p KNAG_0M00700 [Huiozyma naganishii CBS 8797]|uniref:SWR1-complex protein 5 n=1 Tax=Huiozyma naganishii (strain ATCC MYA-139 / BCRC 22969 / CBS 8797 / KCTC 17520 / NBRC 10181 / NCYC 3082 / Yp74L-3) TaxID=1071383 RepID=J7RSM7_HUIN7|nr:hypothetical protein KNAG_0M00700 [Kazachstania naganishii CBS 8797]CCK72923.1 hypothetical protein KNAG_0M00700 [Kazachstania naganishii CBS 8797]
MTSTDGADVSNVIEDDDGYVEEEDLDFVPEPRQGVTEEAAEDDEGEEDDGERDGKLARSYAALESETGGLVKTRHGRQVEKDLKRKNRYEHMMEGGSATLSPQIESIWEELSRESEQRLHNVKLAKKSVLSDVVEGDDNKDIGLDNQSEQILIERTYKFAGETITEKKMVPRSSAMAKEFLNSLKFKSDKTTTNAPSDNIPRGGLPDEDKQNLRRPLKRKSILEDIIAGSLKPKLTTLEKSKLDWVKYVDKAGIHEDLQLHNKDGYLERQDFLNRVEQNKDTQYKELRKKQLEMQLNTQQN